MKKNLTIGIWLTAVILLTSCKKNLAPAVCLSPMADSAYVGEVLSFATCTNDEQLYVWNFGDGTIDSLSLYAGEYTSHAYSAPGTYTGSLTIFTNEGQSNKKTFTVHVVPGGMWTFGGTTYQAVSYSYSYPSGINNIFQYTIATMAADSVDNISFTFYTPVSMVPNGTYAIVGAGYIDSAVLVSWDDLQYIQPSAGQVMISLSHGNNTYWASGGPSSGHNAIVTVTNGQVNISATGIPMVNQPGNTPATGTLNVNLTRFP